MRVQHEQRLIGTATYNLEAIIGIVPISIGEEGVEKVVLREGNVNAVGCLGAMVIMALPTGCCRRVAFYMPVLIAIRDPSDTFPSWQRR